MSHGHSTGSFLAPEVPTAAWQQQHGMQLHGSMASPRHSTSVPAAQPVYNSAFMAAVPPSAAPVYESSFVAAGPGAWPPANHEQPQRPLKMARSMPSFGNASMVAAGVRPEDSLPLSPTPKRSSSMASGMHALEPHCMVPAPPPLSVQPPHVAQMCMSPTSGASSAMAMDSSLMGFMDGGLNCLGAPPVMAAPADAKAERRRAAAVAPMAPVLGGPVAAIGSPRNKKRAAPGAGVSMSKAAPNPNGHSCTQCGTQTTPVWRAGPHGPKTLCNACESARVTLCDFGGFEAAAFMKQG